MTSHAEIKPSSFINRACERGHFLLLHFSFSAATFDLKGMKETALMAGKDTARIVFAGNDPKYLDFLKS